VHDRGQYQRRDAMTGKNMDVFSLRDSKVGEYRKFAVVHHRLCGGHSRGRALRSPHADDHDLCWPTVGSWSSKSRWGHARHRARVFQTGAATRMGREEWGKNDESTCS